MTWLTDPLKRDRDVGFFQLECVCVLRETEFGHVKAKVDETRVRCLIPPSTEEPDVVRIQCSQTCIKGFNIPSISISE